MCSKPQSRVNVCLSLCNPMYRVFFRNVLGVISPHPCAMLGDPEEQMLTSKCKNGIHSTRQFSGQGGLEKQEGEEGRPVHSSLLAPDGWCGWARSPILPPTPGMGRRKQAEEGGECPPQSVHRSCLPQGHCVGVTREPRYSACPERLYKRYITWWHQ